MSSSKRTKKVRSASPETEMLSTLTKAEKAAEKAACSEPEPVAGSSKDHEITPEQKQVIQEFIDQSSLLAALQDYTLEHPLGLLQLHQLMSESVGIVHSNELTNITSEHKVLWREAQIATKKVMKPYLSRNGT